MSKVKITQEQASEIELRKQNFSNESTIEKHLEGWKSIRILNLLTLDELIRALYIGYEVEPEFKKGDIVKDVYCGVREIAEVNEEGMFLYTNYKNTEKAWFGNKTDDYKRIRHATDIEVEAYKKRRFWSKNNRDVWELKKGDILKDRNLYYYSVIQPNLYKPAQNETRVTGGLWIADEDLEKNYKVACFAHDRKDLKND